MFSLRSYEKPQTTAQVLELLDSKGKHVILGGGHWLRLGTRSFDAGLDLSLLEGYKDITYVSPEEERPCSGTKLLDPKHADVFDCTKDSLRLGAGVSYGITEDLPWVRQWMGGVLTKALKGIVSKQMRNTATLGASVFSRFAFSDSLPVLLATGATVKLARAGELTVEELLGKSAKDLKGDFMESLTLPAQMGWGAYEAIRTTANDFPLVCMCVTYIHKSGPNQDGALAPGWHVAVGARPGAAVLAPKTAQALEQAFANAHKNKTPVTPEAIGALMKDAQKTLLEEVTFGAGSGASKAYRQSCVEAMFPRLVTQILSEVHRAH